MKATQEEAFSLSVLFCPNSAFPPSKPLSPHKIRHSAITAVLDASNGNVRLAQRFSRHKSLEVLIKYDDNRQQLQKEAISLIAGLV